MGERRQRLGVHGPQVLGARAGRETGREGGVPEDIERYGEVARREGTLADLKVDRSRVAEVLGSILDRHAVLDVSVQDPPLEQVIARVFEEGRKSHDAA